MSEPLVAEIVERGVTPTSPAAGPATSSEAADPRSTQLAVVEHGPINLFGADRPEEVIARASSIATALKEVVTKQGLISRIGDRQYPQVEAWTMLGSMLGVFPITVWTRKLDNDQGWEARVEARTRGGEVVGAAEAQCSRDEGPWSFHPTNRSGKSLTPRDDYALRAMAQTRATSRALRQPLGFVMVLAGYEATPEAEMPSGGSGAPASGSPGEPWGEAVPAPKPETPGAATKAQKQKLAILAGELGWDDERRHKEAGKLSFNQLTKHEASELIEKWSAVLVAGAPQSEPEGDEPSRMRKARDETTSGSDDHVHVPVDSPTLDKFENCSVPGCMKVRRKGTEKWA